MRTGAKNLITDVAGLLVGNASDEILKSGTTVLTGEKPFTAAVDIMGGTPGTRETDLLAPDKLVQKVDALVLSGGSAFGLDAASGVVERLHKLGRGFVAGPSIVPIVPAAILFDLNNGGDKNWGTNPYPKLGAAAFDNATVDFELGTQGAGSGATTATLKGGLGSASVILDNGHTVGALVAVNALGSATPRGCANFWAAPFEVSSEFGGLGPSVESDPFEFQSKIPLQGVNTTIAIVATDVRLDKAQAKRMAVAAQDGLARALVPSHTPHDGDLIFAVSTGQCSLSDPFQDALLLGHAAATCLSRAVARAVYSATAQKNDVFPTWQDQWG